VTVRKLIFLLVIEVRFLTPGCAKGAFHGVLVSSGNAAVPRGFRITTLRTCVWKWKAVHKSTSYSGLGSVYWKFVPSGMLHCVVG